MCLAILCNLCILWIITSMRIFEGGIFHRSFPCSRERFSRPSSVLRLPCLDIIMTYAFMILVIILPSADRLFFSEAENGRIGRYITYIYILDYYHNAHFTGGIFHRLASWYCNVSGSRGFASVVTAVFGHSMILCVLWIFLIYTFCRSIIIYRDIMVLLYFIVCVYMLYAGMFFPHSVDFSRMRPFRHS